MVCRQERRWRRAVASYTCTLTRLVIEGAIPLQRRVRLSSMLCTAWEAALLVGLLALAQGGAATRSLPHSRALEQDNGSTPARPQPEIELPGPSPATSGGAIGGSQAQPPPECFVTVDAGAPC